MRLTMPDRKPRYGIEVVCEYGFRPLAHVLARLLAPLRVPPPAVALAACSAGIAAAVEIGRGELVAAALVLQLKTVLDNADGQLARLSGRVSAFGRYLDSESDLVVDAALFAALGLRLGPWLALAGFLALTFVLGANYNVERLYRRAGGEEAAAMPPAGDRPTRVLARVYALVYGPQDRVVEALARRRPRAWHRDAVAVWVLANFGLSTQLAVLGLCLVLGHPAVYLAVLVGCVAAVAVLALRRERLARRALQPIVVLE